MSNYRAIQTIVILAGKEVDGYELQTGLRGFSANGLEVLCSASENSVRRFSGSKAFNPVRGGGLSVRHYLKNVQVADSNITSITFCSCEFATQFILHQASKGNKAAWSIITAMVEVSLEARLQQAFTGLDMPEEVRVGKETEISALQQARFATKASHSAFLNACYRHHYPAGQVHDAITTKVAGMTAEQARQLEMVLEGENPDVGLAHYSNADLLMKVATAKQKFSMLRSGSWQEKVSKV